MWSPTCFGTHVPPLARWTTLELPFLSLEFGMVAVSVALSRASHLSMTETRFFVYSDCLCRLQPCQCRTILLRLSPGDVFGCHGASKEDPKTRHFILWWSQEPHCFDPTQGHPADALHDVLFSPYRSFGELDGKWD